MESEIFGQVGCQCEIRDVFGDGETEGLGTLGRWRR